MRRDKAFAWAVVIGRTIGSLVTILSGFGPGSVLGAVQVTAFTYLLLAPRGAR